MEIQALRFVLFGKDPRITPVLLKLDAAHDLETIRKENAPAAFIIGQNTLEYLKSFKNIVEDRGEKRPSIDLARRLLGRKKIPAIDATAEEGGYGTARRMINGVRHLLLRAEKGEKDGRDHNIYFVSATETLFQKLAQDSASNRGAASIPISASQSSYTPYQTDASGLPSRLIDLLCGVEVPEDLETRYVGKAEEVQLVRKLIMRVAHFREPVLILGDTGTGKEIVARAIHKYSGRPAHAFSAINCGAIPSELFESELFGIESGVATAVAKRIGLWELASGGSLFLDELGELSPSHQAKILRALQENRIRRVGGTTEIPVDARIIAATNKDLFSLVQRGQFREDLYYRLRGLLIRTPSMREHPEDTPLLADHLWNKITGGERDHLSNEILEELQAYSWPGNVRELKMVLSGLHTLFYDTPRLGAHHLRAIFAFQGQSVKTSKDTNTANEDVRGRVGYVQYLRRIYEVIRAAHVTVQPVLTDKQEVGGNTLSEVEFGLQHRLDELDTLLQHDLYPMPRHIFDQVMRLHSTLIFFIRGARRDSAAALEDLRQNGPTDFSSALASLMDELGTLKEQA